MPRPPSRKIAVPEAELDSVPLSRVTSPAPAPPAPTLAELETDNVAPLLTETGPVTVLAFVRASVPPLTLYPPVPLTTPLSVTTPGPALVRLPLLLATVPE